MVAVVAATVVVSALVVQVGGVATERASARSAADAAALALAVQGPAQASESARRNGAEIVALAVVNGRAQVTVRVGRAEATAVADRSRGPPHLHWQPWQPPTPGLLPERRRPSGPWAGCHLGPSPVLLPCCGRVCGWWSSSPDWCCGRSGRPPASSPTPSRSGRRPPVSLRPHSTGWPSWWPSYSVASLWSPWPPC